MDIFTGFFDQICDEVFPGKTKRQKYWADSINGNADNAYKKCAYLKQVLQVKFAQWIVIVSKTLFTKSVKTETMNYIVQKFGLVL